MDMKRFLEKVASATPTPGGGSASALAGALSASLILMTAGLSHEKGKLREGELREIERDVRRIRKRLIRAIQDDAESYEAVLKAFHLPRDTEKERLARVRAIQKAYQKATVTPHRVVQQSMRLLRYALGLVRMGNPNALSDAGVAAFLADAAIKGGLITLRINLGSIRDKSFRREMGQSMRQSERRRNHLIVKIEEALGRALPF